MMQLFKGDLQHLGVVFHTKEVGSFFEADKASAVHLLGGVHLLQIVSPSMNELAGEASPRCLS